MKRRITSVVLTLVLMLSALLPQAYATGAGSGEMLQVLAVLSVMNGDENGNLNLAKNVTRAEFTKMAIAASVYKDTGTSMDGVSPYSDVSSSHWAAGYITVARDAGLLSGYLDGTFKPNDTVTLAEAVTIVLRVLGYSDDSFTGVWPSGQMALYRSLDLDANISAMQSSPMTRQSCAWLIYNMLTAATPDGSVYASKFGYKLDSSGAIDYLELLNSKLDGPIVVESGSWQSALGFTPLVAYRNDALSSVSSVSGYDVVYYLKEIKTVWAYSSRKTGTITAISPDRSSPTGVTVAGKSYTLSTSDAMMAVSSYGQFKVGDTVTLLLGRDDKVVKICAAGELETTLYGVVKGTGTDTFTSSSGSDYTAKYVDVIATDGATYRYTTTKNFTDGDVVQVTSDDSGTDVSIMKSNNSISGKVDSKGEKLGSYPLADNVEIIDAYYNSVCTVSAYRLRGLTLRTADILACSINELGEAEKIILNDVTGDIHTYGLLLAKPVSSGFGEMNMRYSYNYLYRGVDTTLSIGSLNSNVGKGDPIQIRQGRGEGLMKLSSINVSAMTDTSVSTKTQKYTLSDDVQVYIKQGDNYYLSAVDLINTEDYSISAWYDKAESSGGRVRILTATARQS